MSKTIVIHHSADFDGLFCREIARKFLPDAELIGWDFGDRQMLCPREGNIYVLDLPFLNGPLKSASGGDFQIPPEAFNFDQTDLPSRVVWIDHHKSSIDSHPTSIPGYRIDGVAACRLAWHWFNERRIAHPHEGLVRLAQKQDFIDRNVSEPWAVRLAGEYDIWRKDDPDAELFQHGLRSCDLTELWPWLLKMDEHLPVSDIEKLMDAGRTNDLLRPDGTTPNPTVLNLLDKGSGIQYAQERQNASIIKAQGFTLQWEGLTFCACNHARFNSLLFAAGLKPEHDACYGFCWDGSKSKWKVSLYHAPGKEQHDLSLIAVKYGGGGHRGACGFLADKLPFLT